MDIDSQSLTPPGSPILGYSGMRNLTGVNVDTNSAITDYTRELSSELESEISLTFCCTGGYSDLETFSPAGYFRRNGVILSLRGLELTSSSRPLNLIERARHQTKFFGFHFTEISEPQLLILISMCRKRIATIENLSWVKYSPPFPVFGRPVVRQPYHMGDSNYEKPFLQRLEIAKFLTFLINCRSSKLNKCDFNKLFGGLVKSLGSVRQWPSSLQHHCGSKTGNQCSSSEFHLFHLHLELRWCLLVISNLKESVQNWILDDLLQLALLKFKVTDKSLATYSTPFNCSCVAELWAMLRIFLTELKTADENCFWTLVIAGIGRMELDESETFFPLWMLSHLAHLQHFDLTGEKIFVPIQQISNVNNCYGFVNSTLKDWLAVNGNISIAKSTELHAVVRRFFTQWNIDLSVITCLWSYWFQRIDKGVEVRNMDPFTTGSKWLHFSSTICDNFEDLGDTFDPFLGFIDLLAETLRKSTIKDFRKLSSAIYSRMSPKIVENLGEIGLTRMITIFLCMAYVAKSDTQVACERLNETLHYAKESLALTKVRGRCSLILLLLQKSIPICSVYMELMRSVDAIMGTLHRNSTEKDVIMVYLELIENLPKYSPHINLDQSKLISLNLTPWLASSGPNYVSRTLRILHSIFQNWLLDTESVPTSEKSRTIKIIQEKVESFLQQSILDDLGLVQAEPYAELATDLTICCKRSQNSAGLMKFFQLFGLNPRTPYKISEIYISRLTDFDGILNDFSNITEIQWTQCWIRLVTVGGTVPLNLSSRVLSVQNEPISTLSTNESLLRSFCKFINSSECFWTKVQLAEILCPMILELKNLLERPVHVESAPNSESIIISCVVLIRKVSFDKIYSRNSQSSVAYELLEKFIPSFLGKSPWEKLSQKVLKILRKYLHQIFILLTSNPLWNQDGFLRRKVCDTFRFAFLGFITTAELEDDNPCFLIMRHLEGQYTSNQLLTPLLDELMISLQQLTREDQLMKRFLLGCLGLLKRRMYLSIVWMFGILFELLIEKDAEVGAKCSGILTNCLFKILERENSDVYRVHILAAFEASMSKHFSFRSKRFFDFANLLASYAARKPILGNFVYNHIVPILTNHITVSEAKQGSGSNYALRTQLQLLEAALAKTMEPR